jgi:hypothetical protein
MKSIKKHRILKFNQFRINELTEFNLQRMNPDSVQASVHVDDPSLSLNSFDKHQDSIRLAMSRVNDILYNLKGTNVYKNLRGKLALEVQDVKSMRVLRIIKSNNISYDAYISFIIDENEYWGVIKNLMTYPELESEVFKDFDLEQSKEWIIKTKGLVIKVVKNWLKPEPGMYRLANDEVTCYSTETGKMLKMEKDIEIEVVRAHDNKIIIKHENDSYNLVGDNYVYFNWWFEKVA